MRKSGETKIGCFLTAALFVLIAVLYKGVSFLNPVPSPSDEISWAKAAEKCKDRYRNIHESWRVKVPNCRKRTEDENLYYFYWRKPISIFVEQANGQKSANSGDCFVDKKSGEIVYMSFNKSIVVDTLSPK